MAGIYTLAREDYAGLKDLAISTGGAMAIALSSKYAFSAISKRNPSLARISRRPNMTDFDGFPSGHTTSAFSAAGFMWKRYGHKLGVPTTAFATLVGISRVTSNRHTIPQVIAGAILGGAMAYFITGESDDFSLTIDINSEISRESYSVILGYKF